MMTLRMVPEDPALFELIGSLNSIGSGIGFRNTERALNAITTAIARAWQNSVGSDHRIQKKRITPFSHYVYSEDKVVHWIEEGLPPYDMRMTHPFGKKSRVVKPRYRKGQPIRSWIQTRKDGTKYRVSAGDEYLIIPFRKRTTSSKAPKGEKSFKDVYPQVSEQMKSEGFERTQVVTSASNSEIETPNAMGEMVKRARYSWGTRFYFPETDEFRSLQGMVAMGNKGHTQFMNFRIVSVNSPNGSWQHPGIKARHNLRNIVESGQDQIREAIGSALRRDIG